MQKMVARFCDFSLCVHNLGYLQDEDKVIDRLVSLEEVVLGSVLALGVELELLHNAGMFDQTQQNLLRQVARPKRFHLCKVDAHVDTQVGEESAVTCPYP